MLLLVVVLLYIALATVLHHAANHWGAPPHDHRDEN